MKNKEYDSAIKRAKSARPLFPYITTPFIAATYIYKKVYKDKDDY